MPAHTCHNTIHPCHSLWAVQGRTSLGCPHPSDCLAHTECIFATCSAAACDSPHTLLSFLCNNVCPHPTCSPAPLTLYLHHTWAEVCSLLAPPEWVLFCAIHAKVIRCTLLALGPHHTTRTISNTLLGGGRPPCSLPVLAPPLAFGRWGVLACALYC